MQWLMPRQRVQGIYLRTAITKTAQQNSCTIIDTRIAYRYKQTVWPHHPLCGDTHHHLLPPLEISISFFSPPMNSIVSINHSTRYHPTVPPFSVSVLRLLAAFSELQEPLSLLLIETWAKGSMTRALPNIWMPLDFKQSDFGLFL